MKTDSSSKLSGKRVAIRRSIDKVLKRTALLSLATVNKNGSPHLNTAFFARYQDDLFFLSDIRSNHCRNIKHHPMVAVTVFDSRQKWDSDKSGVQIFGRAAVCDPRLEIVARKSYVARFRDYASYLKEQGAKTDPNFKFFVIHMKRFVLLDEDKFGEETFIRIHA